MPKWEQTGVSVGRTGRYFQVFYEKYEDGRFGATNYFVFHGVLIIRLNVGIMRTDPKPID